jgi:signal peptidase I
LSRLDGSLVCCRVRSRGSAALFAVMLLIATICCQGATKVFTIPNSSMEPTIKEGEKIAADMQPFQPARGDLVIFTNGGIILVKRVIGVAGDVIEGRDFKVFVNGKLLTEPYVQHIAKPPLDLKTLEVFGPTSVPEGKIFVAGDNRDYSFDSRDPRFGLVAISDIKGRPVQIIHSSTSEQVGSKLK